MVQTAPYPHLISVSVESYGPVPELCYRTLKDMLGEVTISSTFFYQW
jgi:hypothetical protein